jgi:hypothetical protein
MQNVYEREKMGFNIVTIFNDADDAYLKIIQNADSADCDSSYMFRNENTYRVKIGAMIGEYYDVECFISDAQIKNKREIKKVRELFKTFENHFGIEPYDE